MRSKVSRPFQMRDLTPGQTDLNLFHSATLDASRFGKFIWQTCVRETFSPIFLIRKKTPRRTLLPIRQRQIVSIFLPFLGKKKFSPPPRRCVRLLRDTVNNFPPSSSPGPCEAIDLNLKSERGGYQEPYSSRARLASLFQAALMPP